VAIALGLVLLAACQLSRPAAERVELDWRAAVWMWPWLIGLAAISSLASFDGGTGDLPFGVDVGVTAAFSLAIFAFALSCRLSGEETLERLRTSSEEELAL
jgi:hypothetical protein